MVRITKQNYWRLLLFIGLPAIIVPLIYVFLMTITTDQESITIDIDTNSGFQLVFFAFYLLLITGFLAAGIYWVYSKISELIDLKNEKMKMEVQHLQNQINPHFFFNMLNNLFGLIERDPSRAKNIVLTLSNMMRYSIYEGQKELVTLREELEYLGKFIQLNESRYYKKSDIRFVTEIEDDAVEVTPLLFIVLVENAFKHGVERLTKEAFVHIHLQSNSRVLELSVKNNFDAEELPDEPGIGIANLERRLELLYPKRHELIIDKKDSIYTATLKIWLR